MPDLAQPTSSILLIDDDPTLRELVADVLTEEGYAVTTVGSSWEAAAALDEQNDYALIISDTISSEPSNSWSWLNQLRASTDKPILIFSAHDSSRFNGWQDRGFAEVLTKPFDIDDLIRLVERLTM